MKKSKVPMNLIVLGEAFRLLEIEAEDMEVYKLTDEQKRAIHESQNYIKKGDFLTNDQANKEIDEWLHG